jgi:hypothetical protein
MSSKGHMSASMSSPTHAKAHSTETSRISNVLSYAILLGGILTIAVTLYMVVTSYSSLPFWDGWEVFQFAANGGDLLSPAWLWRLHNEHRMVIPKLFLAADMRLFQARQVFLLASIFGIQLMHLALLSWSMRVLGGWRGALLRSGTGLAAFCLFCPSQYENFVWSFQVDFVLPQLLATLSFVGLALYWVESEAQPEIRPSSKSLLISILASLGATFSLASGNLLWPLLVAAALYLRLRVRAILSFAGVGAVSISAYLYHYVAPEAHANPAASLGSPLKVLKYCSTYLINVWPIYSTGQSIALWLAMATLLLPVLPCIRKFRPFAIQLVLTMLYCVATALITAAGRVSFGISQAASSRYQTVALLFWCSLGLAWLGGAFLARLRVQHCFLVAQACLLVIFARGAERAKDTVALVHGHAFAPKAATAALLTGVFDPVSLAEVSDGMGVLIKSVPYMKANRLSVFSDSLASIRGKPLESIFHLAGSNECSGALESVVPVDSSNGSELGPGLRMLGWVSDRRRQRLPLTIVVTTNGTIVGLGAAGKFVPYVHGVNLGLPSRYDGFVAYAPPLPSGSTVNVYAILRGSPPSACYIDRMLK